jgi:hypothetical protein
MRYLINQVAANKFFKKTKLFNNSSSSSSRLAAQGSINIYKGSKSSIENW